MENAPTDVVKKIVQDADTQDVLDALARTSKGFRGLVKDVKRGVRIEVTQAMVVANKQGLDAIKAKPTPIDTAPGFSFTAGTGDLGWYTHEFDYPELRGQIQTLVATLSHIAPPRKLTLVLYAGETDHAIMPALPLVLTSKVKVVSLTWSGMYRPATNNFIPAILFNPAIYTSLHKLKAPLFEVPDIHGAVPNIHIVECMVREERGIAFTLLYNLPTMHVLRITLSSNRIERLPRHVKSLWISGNTKERVQLALHSVPPIFTFGPVEPTALALEDLVLTDMVFDPRAMDKMVKEGPTDLFSNVRRLALFRCTFTSMNNMGAFRSLFPPDIEIVARELNIMDSDAMDVDTEEEEDTFRYVEDDEAFAHPM